VESQESLLKKQMEKYIADKIEYKLTGKVAAEIKVITLITLIIALSSPYNLVNLG